MVGLPNEKMHHNSAFDSSAPHSGADAKKCRRNLVSNQPLKHVFLMARFLLNSANFPVTQ